MLIIHFLGGTLEVILVYEHSKRLENIVLQGFCLTISGLFILGLCLIVYGKAAKIWITLNEKKTFQYSFYFSEPESCTTKLKIG